MCSQGKSDGEKDNVKDSINAPLSVVTNHKGYDHLDSAIGFVGLKEEAGINPTLELYNRDGSLYKKLEFSAITRSGDLQPYAFHLDNYLLWFRCKKKNDEYYEVVINEEDGIKKLVRTNDPILSFNSWEQIILNAFSINFSPEDNPLRKSSSSDSEIIYYEEDEFYLPVSISGDWLKVKWGSENKWYYGFIKWKDNTKVLVELNFFA